MRFDHALIAVADLDAAAEAYRRLGFAVVRGGDHPTWGTSNALIFLESGYLELLAVSDPAVTRRLGPPGEALLEFVATRPGGLVGFALGTEAIEEDAERLADAGIAAEGPFAMERRRPDGTVVSWRLLVPGGRAWLTPWPFFIEWSAPPPGGPTDHANAAIRVDRLTVAVDALEPAMRNYEALLGVPAAGEGITVDGFTIVVESGAAPGLGELTLRTADLDLVAAVTGAPADGGVVRPDPATTSGARLAFRA